MGHRFLALLAIGCLAVSLSSATVASGSPLVQRSEAKAKTFHITIVNNKKTTGAYKPNTITVHRGDKIVFKNVSNAIHTVTAKDGKSFDSKNINIGKSWTFTAKHVGTFPYTCVHHPLMNGKIIVKA